MQPGRVPTDEIVTDPDDFEYVNRKISASGARDPTARAVKYGEGPLVGNSTSSGSRQSSNAFKSSVLTTPASISGQRRAAEPTTPSTSIKGILKNRPMQVSSPTYDEPTRSRPLCSADFEGSDDEDDISYTNIWEDAGAVRPPEDILQCPEAEMRKIQLLLQAKILREIAELVHEPGADYRLWGDAVAGWADEGDY